MRVTGTVRQLLVMKGPSVKSECQHLQGSLQALTDSLEA